MSDSKEVALFGDKEQMPAYMGDAQNQGLGNENVGAEDYAIPRIELLQALSAAVDSVPDAKAGMYRNSITNEVVDEIYVVNLSYRKQFTIFKDRKLGGGWGGTFESEEAAAAALPGLDGDVEDWSVVPTCVHTLLTLNVAEGSVEADQPVEFLMSGTKVRTSDAWNTEIHTRGKNAPRFAGVWKLSADRTSNKSGTWYAPAIEFQGWAPPELFEQAKVFYESISQKAA